MREDGDGDQAAQEGLGPEDPTLQSPIPPPSEPVELGDDAVSTVRQWSRPAEDLTGEPLLRRCDMADFEGNPRPRLGRIALLAKLGHGGMGVVYYGVHTRLDSEVAVKLLPPILSSRQQDLLDRFEREAKIAARLHSDHLVGVHDIDTDDATDCHFIVMDYVHGPSADAWIKRFEGVDPGVPEAAALDLCIAAARGLSTAHVEGVVHRDLKPANILIPEDESGNPLPELAKLADLGLARAEMSDQSVTGSSVAMGTPGYMAPEQAMDAKTAKKPADVFGLGATLYAVLAGKAPFAGSSAAEAIVKTATGQYVPLEELRPDVSDVTHRLVETCLAPEPADRFADASALLEALQVARDALGDVDDWAEAATRVQDIAQREELGKRVLTDAAAQPSTRGGGSGSPASWRNEATLQMKGAAPGDASAAPDAAPDAGVSGGGTGDGDGGGAEPISVELDRAARNRRSVLIGLLLMVPTALATWAVVGGGGDSAMLYVTTKPPGMDVWVDGNARGVTPLLVPGLAEGGHRVRVAGIFHDEQSGVANTTLGDTTTVHYELVRGTGRLRLTGGAPGATVTLTRDGETEPAYVFEVADDGAPTPVEQIEAGKYVLVAERPGFDRHEAEIKVARGAEATAQLRMDGLTGMVTIVSQPAGAEVVLGDEVLGTTPLDHAFPVGAHTVTVRLAGHQARQIPVEAVADAASVADTVVLAPWGTLALGKLDAGVTVRHDGRVVRDGQPLPPGGVQLDVSRDGYAPQSVTVTVPLGEVARLRLRPWSGFQALLDLTGVPDGVDVSVDGKRASGVITYAAPGAHVVEFSREGRAPQRITVQTALGKIEQVVPGPWEERTGSLDVSGLPEGVRWTFADGVRRDPAWLAPGTYRVRLERGGKLPQEVTVEIVADEAFALAPPPRWENDPRGWTAARALLADLAAWDAATAEERSAAAVLAAAHAPGFAFDRMGTFEGGEALHHVGVFEHEATGLEFVLVPVGTFTMGSPEDEHGRKDDEPQRSVKIAAPFLAARTELTQRAWERVMESNPSRYAGKDHPVENVSWKDAVAFCEKAGLALPTEAQWEYMCRAGTQLRYSGFEREPELDLYAWTKDNAGRRGTSPVGTKRPNGFGLLDVHGNVWEWCADVDPDRTDVRVYRGGSWRNSARSARCAHRFLGEADTRDAVLGFRPVFVLTD